MKKLAVLAGALALGLIGAGLYVLMQPAPATDLTGCNIIVVAIDSLRADHLGCFGYKRDTSPFIDSLAPQSVFFENAQSVSSYTCEVVPALLSGLLPSSGRTGLGWLGKVPPTDNLGELFTRAGYKTGLFTDQPKLSECRAGNGFGEADYMAQRLGISQQGPLLSARALEFVRQNKRSKFMMYLHYMDPHAPYTPKKESYLRFAEQVYDKPLDLYEQVRPVLPQLRAEGFGPGEARFEDLVLRYDAEVYEADQAIRLLLEGLKKEGVLDKTLVVITADHGEEFLEHGFVEHAWRLYRESVHVPLFFYAPKFLAPARVSAPVSLIDMAPTLLSLAGIKHERTDLDGTPLFGDAAGDTVAFTPRTKPLIAELMLETRDYVRMVIDGDFKYLAAQRWLTPEQCAHQSSVQEAELEQLANGTLAVPDRWGPVVREELYNIKNDPAEEHPLEGHEEVLARMRKTLEDYRLLCASKPKVEGQKSKMTDEQRQQMKDLGY